MEALLELLKKNARESNATLAKQLATTEADVRARIADYEKNGVIRAYQAVINEDRLDSDDVRAVIELRSRPEHNGGFDRLAHRISQYAEVESMYLVSGGYDLLLFVKGRSLQQVANFVSSQLASLDGVISTATHFMLKTYKDQGVLMEKKPHDHRLQICP